MLLHIVMYTDALSHSLSLYILYYLRIVWSLTPDISLDPLNLGIALEATIIWQTSAV